MIDVAVLTFACVFIITVMALYIPIVHIRISNKILKCLEQIETNTRIERAFNELSQKQ